MSDPLKYVEITVPYYIPIAIIGIFLGITTSGGVLDFNTFISFLSISLLIAAFNTFNGVTDLKIDIINKPNRPIPSGKISKKNAMIYSFFLYLLSSLFAYTLNARYFQLTVLTAIITILYSVPIVRLRKRLVISNFCGAIIYGLLCPLLGWAINPSNPIPIYMLIFTFLFAFSLSLSKDFEDHIGDKVFRMKTIPVVFGIQRAKMLSTIMLVVSFSYLIGISLIGLIETQYLYVIITLPGFILLIRKIYSNHNKFYNSVEERNVAKRIFYMLIVLALTVEMLIGLIAIF